MTRDSASPTLPIIIVDDDAQVVTSQANVLRANGFEDVVTLTDSRQTINTIEERGADLLMLDLAMPYMDGRSLLHEVHERYPEIPIIILTANTQVATAVSCMREGASDYMTKPVEPNRFVSGVRRALEVRRLTREYIDLRRGFLAGSVSNTSHFGRIVTRSPLMNAVFIYIEAIATTRETVVITGETGTGKDLVAEAIHSASGRRGPFVRVNSAGLDDAVFSDTLFGHAKGAYTGALDARKGLVAQAGSGTVFLDEIGDMTPQSQVKLLELLERREYYPLGADLPRRTDARFVVATNRDIAALAEERHFRRDLYYRLSTHVVNLPPLRDRPEDLPLLVDHFVAQACDDLNRTPLTVSPGLVRKLQRYRFPGNVRELRSLIIDAVARTTGSTLSDEPFRALLVLEDEPAVDAASDADVIWGEHLPTIRSAIDLLVTAALERCGGNQAAAAGLLGITPQALSKRLKRRSQAGRS